mgnify:CR=1 FL=1
MTIILKPKCKITDLKNLTIEIANCMQKTIYDLFEIRLDIKEPNDLILNGKKISGILTEINTIGDKINYLLISIGFNVNEEFFSDDLKDIATSLKKEFDKYFSREEIIVSFIRNLEITLKENESFLYIQIRQKCSKRYRKQ